MSRKSRERREKNKTVRPDDYFSNGTFEMARFGKNTIVRNNRTPEQHAAQMEYLRAEYASKYEDIAQKVKSLKEKVTQCDPYSLLMYLRSLATMGQMNIFSEIEYSSDANAIIRAQEYVQSILVSTDNNYVPSSPSEEAALHAQIVADFDELYKDFRFFYHFWAAHIQKSGKIGDSRLNEIVESQYMYWVRGNRYQIFELEPLKSLLPPHNDVLLELFGVSSAEVAGQIKYALKRQRELKRAVPLAAFGDIKYCTFISMPGIIQYPIQEQLDYAYAAASRNEEIPVMWISLEYDNKKRLVSAKGKKCFFSDLEGDDIERIRHMGREKARDWVLQYKMTHGKIGRNDYCPCGSGKKYKFCCIEIQ